MTCGRAVAQICAGALIAAIISMASVGAAGAADSKERLKVVATLPVLGDLAREVGGELVDVVVLAHPDQDPHFVQARPTLMKRTRDADVFIELGLSLEIWAQKVVDGAGNSAVQRGQPGRIIASAGIPTLERPVELSRAAGDVHPEGNPHIWLDPMNGKRMAANIAAGLARVRPEARQTFEAGAARFASEVDRRMFGDALVGEIGAGKLSRLLESGELSEYLGSKGLEDRLGGWLAAARSLRGAKIVTYHRSWPYFARRFGLTVPVEIEEKPGITPSAKHRDRVVEIIEAEGVRAIAITRFYDRRAADYIAGKTGVPVVEVAIEPSSTSGGGSYLGFVGYLVDTLARAVEEVGS